MTSKTRKRPRAIGILRVSQRNRNEDSRHSEEVQRRLVVNFAKSQGWELRPEDVLNENDITDGNVSGGADLSKRPGFGPAVARVERGQADVILTADFSRFFRDLDVQRDVIAQVEDAGGELWTVSNGRISHETAESELTANIQGSVTHYAKRYARDKSMLAVDVAIENGKVPWCQTAPGYVRNPNSTLTPDSPAVQKVIRTAFEMRANGQTIAAVRVYLREHGIEKSYHGTIHLLRDRIYLGEIRFNGRVNLAAHEPIIDRELFQAAQDAVIPRGYRPVSNRLLSRVGVLRCSTCGGRMVVGTQRQNGRSYPFYRCGHVREDCAKRMAISATMVEAAVTEKVKELLADMRGTASGGTGVAEAAAELERCQQALDAAITAFADLMAEPAAIERLRLLRDARDQARDRHEELLANATATTIAVSVNDWDELTLDEQRALVKATIESVVIEPGRGPERIRITSR